MTKQQNKNDVQNSEALRQLNPKFKEVRSLIESLRLKAQLLDLKAVVLGGAYIIFQAIMYGQVNPSSPAPLWFPACLSGSISLAFWPAFVETVNDCMRTRQQQDSSFVEQDKVFRKICSAQTSRPHGGAASQRSLNKAFATVRRQRHAYVVVLYFVLLLLTLCVPCVALNQARGFQLQRQIIMRDFF